MEPLVTLVVLLVATVVAVPLSRRLGLGSVLGYLVAGIAIGPTGLGLVSDVESVMHVSEFGVVMLLFLIGLELKPSRLWVMRRAVFGLGGAQVALCAALIGGAGRLLGLSWPAAAVAGSALALSSTALALPMLAERDLLSSRAGRDSFAVLLFQDLAVIPLVALLPLLSASSSEELTLSDATAEVALALSALAAILVTGRWLIRPVFRLVGSVRAPEAFTATALLVVVGTAALVDAAGLSMSLGAFLAGVLLSDSEYRHQIQADIEPFEGLLLGLFFIGVGMSVNLGLAASAPLALLAATAALVATKMLVVLGLARAAGHEPAGALRMAASLGQGGEFALVLFAAAMAANVLAGPEAQFLTLAVSLSMLATPLLFLAADRLARRLERERPRPFDTIAGSEPPVIICGFGRVGQIVGRVLRMRGIPFTALENSAAQVDFVRRFGSQVYYGDPSRLELLRAAGAERAKLLVLTIDDPETSLKVAEIARRHFPHLTIMARARNRRHAHRLMDLGIEEIVRETYFSSLHLSGQVLKGLDHGEEETRRMIEAFHRHDERTLKEQHAFHDDESQLIQSVRQATEELKSLFEADQERR